MITYALEVVGALVILVVGWLFAGWASRKTRSMIESAHRIDSTLAPFLSTIVRYVILAVVIVAVLGQFGVETTSIIAVLGTVGLAVGLALQGTLSNLAAGVVLLVMRPFRAGEYIDSGSQAGTVREVGLFATILRTFDGVFVYVPNSQLVNTAIKNFTRSETRRIDVMVGISYQEDIDKVLSLALSLLESDARVLKDPPPETMVLALGAGYVDINMRCWVNSADYFAVLFDINRNIKHRLEAEGITIPFPQRELHIVERKSA